MIRANSITILTILLLSFSTANAETYTWIDGQGTMHFTEDLGTVPEKIRHKVRKLDEAESAPKELSPQQRPAMKVPDAIRQQQYEAGDGDGLYAGKTYAQWQKELAERETAMTVVRNSIDEVAALRKDTSASRPVRDKLFVEHAKLLEQFKEMKKQYYEQVEIARKAGLQIDMQQ